MYSAAILSDTFLGFCLILLSKLSKLPRSGLCSHNLTCSCLSVGKGMTVQSVGVVANCVVCLAAY